MNQSLKIVFETIAFCKRVATMRGTQSVPGHRSFSYTIMENQYDLQTARVSKRYGPVTLYVVINQVQH